MKTLTRFTTALSVLWSLHSGSAAPAPTDKPWFDRALVGMEIGPTGAQFGNSDSNDVRYCARFDGREIVRHAVAAHSEYLVLWVRDGDYAYYDSKLLPKVPGLGTRDPLREAMDEARSHQLPIIAYCVVQQGGHFLKAHPEWEMRGADGKPIGRFCYNSGYLEAMKAIVAEQLAYGLAGFHIDMMDQGFGPPYGCWCDTCRAQFEKEFGHPMPKGSTWDDAWDDLLEFRYRTSERFEKALYAHIKSILLKPHRTTRQREGKEGTDWPMSADAPVGPAMLLHAVGRGTVLTIAASPDFATASEHHIVEARRLIRNAVRFLNPTPRVEITAPAQVETVVTDDAASRTLHIHLLGYNSPPQTTPPKDRPFVLPVPIEDAPMYRVVIESNPPLKRAAACCKSTVLKRRGQRVEATVNDVHEVVVLRY